MKFTSALHAFTTRVAAACCVLLSSAVMAAPLQTSPASAPSNAASITPSLGHDLTKADAETWLDGLIPTALHHALVPGAVVVIVKDGQVLFEKGYGYADLKNRIPVDAHNTLFRPGSTSKLFTWTAVMQLVEKGKLDLDADINTYLDFNIPPRDGKPVTLRQLMTHTAGFEETIKELVTFDPPVPPLGDVLKRYVPPRRTDGGSTSGYSNYGASLAGYIVQRVSGVPFDDYIEKNVFAPLAMTSSSFRQPLPPALLARMSVGYKDANTPGRGYELVDMPPAGSLASTGDDMAHFMIAQLQNGKYENSQILQPATAHLMHDSITRLFPDLNGIALGFYEQNINGHRVIAHGGDLNYFHTDLALFVNDNVGLFLSVNAPGKDGMGEQLRVSLFDEFANRYFPQTEPVQHIDESTARADAKLIAGSYISTRRADSTFLGLAGLVSPIVITANADGTITCKTLFEPVTYAEVKPFLWQQVDGPDKLQAIIKDGKVWRWSTNDLAFGFEFEPGNSLSHAGLAMPMVYAAIGIILLAGLAWPAAAIARRKYARPLPFAGREALVYHLAGLGAVLAVAALGVWVAFFAAVAGTESSHLDPFLHLAQLLALLGFCGGWIVALVNLAVEVKAGHRWPSLAWATVRLLAFSVLAWVAIAYHMVGFYSQY